MSKSFQNILSAPPSLPSKYQLAHSYVGLWQLLLFFLAKYDEEEMTRYHKVVSETILGFFSHALILRGETAERQRLPSWLISRFTVCIYL